MRVSVIHPSAKELAPKLSILIPTINTRIVYLSSLLKLLYSQPVEYLNQVEIIISSDTGIKSIGKKRNELLASANGEYVVFIDDDDSVSIDYLEHLFAGIAQGVDHVGITGLFISDRNECKPFKCSAKYEICERDGVYYRKAQHLCAIKSSIAKLVQYPEINFGEDTEWSKKISPLINTEYLIEKPIYEYKYRYVK